MFMVPETTNDPLLLEKHPQLDLFVCDVADAILKDVMQELEHPFYSLSKKPVTTILEYRHGDHWLRITPSVKGLATIYDKDILIYAISQLMAKINRGEAVGPKVRINCREFLMFTNRGTSGRDYMALVDAIERLHGMSISTNIVTGGEEQTSVFGLINSGTVRRKHGGNGRLLWVEIELSNWVFNAIRANEVLTLNRDYFRLGKPYERRAYEIARKHCGRQPEWSISLELLRKKMGATSALKKFRYFLRELAAQGHLPDYTVELGGNDKVTFRNRNALATDSRSITPRPIFHTTATYERAKQYVPRGQDVYGWEQDWIAHWRETGCPALRSADAAFIGFCKSRYVRLQEREKENR
jgi:plasmid replication initiation protein